MFVTASQPPVASRHARARCRVAQQKRVVRRWSSQSCRAGGPGPIRRRDPSEHAAEPGAWKHTHIGLCDRRASSFSWPCRDARRPRPWATLSPARSGRTDGRIDDVEQPQSAHNTHAHTHTHTHTERGGEGERGRPGGRGGGGANVRINSCLCFSRTTSLAQRPLGEMEKIRGIRSFCLVGLGRAPPPVFVGLLVYAASHPSESKYDLSHS